MFKSMRIRNLRSIMDSRNLRLSNLNLIVGPNNAGKSSLLYSLLLLKQTLQDKDSDAVLVTSGPHVNLGSYLDIISGNDPNKNLGIDFEIAESKLELMPERAFLEKEPRELGAYNKYHVDFRFDAPRNSIKIAGFHVSDTKIKKSLIGRKRIQARKWNVTGFDVDLIPHVQPVFHHFLPVMVPYGKRPKDEKIRERVFQLLFTGRVQASMIERIFAEILYVGPVRQQIPRYGILGTQQYSELSPSGQNLMRVLSSAKRLAGADAKTALAELNYWLGTRFGVLKRVRIRNVDKGKTIKSLIADDPRGSKDINLAAMGSGVSQLVPVIVQTVLTPENGCIIVEQPEIHLHPAAQAALGDLFVQYAKDSRQLIIETHSEHLLLRVRRRVAEGTIPPELVNVFFVDKTKGGTRVRRLSLQENGHFKRWPAGFFEEGYQEAMALAMAQTKDKQ